jgi:hypothetical protein
MSDDDDASEGRSPVFRHEPHTREGSPPAELAVGAMEAIEEHMQALFGPIDMVFHEIVSDVVHLDVHHIPPNDACPHHVLFTTGMSALPMTVPDGFEAEQRVELVLALPAHWKVSKEDWADERWYWPIRQMKALARLPHEYNTWLWFGHTIPNGDPPEPYAEGVPFCCALIAPPLLMDSDAQTVEVPSGNRVRFLTAVWLHPGEVVMKLNKGADALFDRFDERGYDDMLDLDRPDVSKRNKFLGIF